MAALATIDDLNAFPGIEIDDDDPDTLRLLEMASAAIERWCNRTFAREVDDEITIHVTDGTLYLPNGPVESVTSITGPTVWGVDGPLVDAAGYQEIHGHIIRRYGWWGCGAYTVVYTHGYETIPDDLVAATCQMVLDILQGPEGPVRSESIGEAARTYIAGRGGITVPAEVKDALRPYRVTPSSVALVR